MIVRRWIRKRVQTPYLQKRVSRYAAGNDRFGLVCNRGLNPPQQRIGLTDRPENSPCIPSVPEVETVQSAADLPNRRQPKSRATHDRGAAHESAIAGRQWEALKRSFAEFADRLAGCRAFGKQGSAKAGSGKAGVDIGKSGGRSQNDRPRRFCRGQKLGDGRGQRLCETGGQGFSDCPKRGFKARRKCSAKR